MKRKFLNYLTITILGCFQMKRSARKKTVIAHDSTEKKDGVTNAFQFEPTSSFRNSSEGIAIILLILEVDWSSLV